MFFNQLRKFSSALYITGDKAQKTFAVLTPAIDFSETLFKKDELLESIKLRQINIDLEKVEKRWEFFKFVDRKREILEHTRAEIGRVISELMKEADKNAKDIEKLRNHSKVIKNDLKNVKDSYYGIEEGAMLKILALPNVLHKKTPKDDKKIIHEYLTKPQQCSDSHMDIGRNFIKYINPMCCFLKGDAAKFELNIQESFGNKLLDLNFSQFSNSDFARSVIIEGCGTNFRDKNRVFTLESPHEKSDELCRLHLTGAGSLFAFMAFFTKHFVQQTQFPLKYFSMGRNYMPKDENLGRNLFNLCQNSVVNLFVATLENDENITDGVIQDVSKIYEDLGYHFRLVLVPAKDLDISESFKVSIQMLSNFLNDYVEVGYISRYENYLSKRLLFSYSVNKERKYPNVIYGEILNIQKMLGCVLENNKTI